LISGGDQLEALSVLAPSPGILQYPISSALQEIKRTLVWLVLGVAMRIQGFVCRCARSAGAPKSLSLALMSGCGLLLGHSAAAVADVANEVSDQDSNRGQLEEIIVTAEKRQERLQDVPIAVSVATSSMLQQALATDTLDLNALIPGLDTQRSGVYTYPAIRGVTTNVSALGNEANVATYIDGFYYPALFGLLTNLSSVDQVEVLKGPQGTLFGRNSTGGAISITTRSPSLNSTSDEFR
jgi:iron complex outermembrane recepter protein